jgi:hypothetical protein
MTDGGTRQWDNLMARLRSVSGRATDGHAIVNMTVVFCAGVPQVWTEPRVTRLEPRAKCTLGELLALLTDGATLDAQALSEAEGAALDEGGGDAG